MNESQPAKSRCESSSPWNGFEDDAGPKFRCSKHQPSILPPKLHIHPQLENFGKMRASIVAVYLLISGISAVTLPAQADCFDEAAQYHSVNPWILRAIAAQESRFNPAAIHPVNANGTRDHGLTGINDILLPELAQYGIGAGDLRDGCKSVFLAGWHLRRMVNKFGNTWAAVGAYNSKTPSKRDLYAGKIRRIIDFWTERGIIPR